MKTTLGRVGGTAAIAVALVVAVSGEQSEPRTSNVTAPNLTGVWVYRSATPLQRPDALRDKPRLTDLEVEQLRERARRLVGNLDNDTPTGDQLYLAVLSDVQAFRNPNATQSVAMDPSLVDRDFEHRTSLITDPLNGRLPPMTPEGQRRQAANAARNFTLPADPRETAADADLPTPAGPEDLAKTVSCITWGIPRLGGPAFYTRLFQIVQTTDHVAIVQEVNHEARLIPVDRRPPLSLGIRQWNGASRGRWEGQTLVVETGNFSPRSFFLGAAENLHLVERFTRTEPDVLEYEVTVSDETTWVRPWTAKVSLRRSDELLYEFACHEGNFHTIRGILGAARAREAQKRE